MSRTSIFAVLLCLGLAACDSGTLTSESSEDASYSAAAHSDILASSDVASKGKGQTKVTICHVPPGNPANAHLITVGAPALQHHLDNHPGDMQILPTIPNPIPDRFPAGGCMMMGPGD